MQFEIINDELISCIPDIPDRIEHSDNGRIRIQSQELDLIIPSGVKKVAKGAFDNCLYINTLFIPESVTTLHPLSLSRVSNLEEIYCEGLTHTGTVFRHMTSLKRITFAKSLKKIDDSSFINIRTLEEITFKDCPLETIGKKAFYQCSHLKSIVLPETVKEVLDLAFTYCGQLESVTLNEGLETFMFQSLCETSNMTVTIPESVTKVVGNESYWVFFRPGFTYRAKKGHPIFKLAKFRPFGIEEI